MDKDRLVGAGIFTTSIAGLLIYGWLLFFTAPQLILQVTAFIAVAAVLGILAWIGYTMATTPPPAPLGAEPPSTQGSNEPPLETRQGK